MEDFSKEEIDQFFEELEFDQEEVKPIETNQGLIAYRKYLWAIKFINKKN